MLKIDRSTFVNGNASISLVYFTKPLFIALCLFSVNVQVNLSHLFLTLKPTICLRSHSVFFAPSDTLPFFSCSFFNSVVRIRSTFNRVWLITVLSFVSASLSHVYSKLCHALSLSSKWLLTRHFSPYAFTISMGFWHGSGKFQHFLLSNKYENASREHRFGADLLWWWVKVKLCLRTIWFILRGRHQADSMEGHMHAWVVASSKLIAH